MSPTVSGALIGAILAVSIILFGFWGFILVAVLMAVGALVARVATGQIDLRALTGVLSGRRTS